MNQRLPITLSTTALVVTLVASTPLGHAAESALEQVVPRARTADFAANAGKLNGHRSSVNPRRGQIPVVGLNGKLSPSIGAVGPAGPAGPKGDSGPAGAGGYQRIERQMSIGGQGFRAEQIECPGGKSVLGAGHLFREQDADHLVLTESRPVSNSTWRFKIENETGDEPGSQSIFVICASMSQ